MEPVPSPRTQTESEHEPGQNDLAITLEEGQKNMTSANEAISSDQVASDTPDACPQSFGEHARDGNSNPVKEAVPLEASASEMSKLMRNQECAPKTRDAATNTDDDHINEETGTKSICAAERLSIEEWPKKPKHPVRYIMQAFYRGTVPTSDGNIVGSISNKPDSVQKDPDLHGKTDMPLRIRIWSPLLRQEIERLSSLTLNYPHVILQVIAPPYKYLPQMESRLDQLISNLPRMSVLDNKGAKQGSDYADNESSMGGDLMRSTVQIDSTSQELRAHLQCLLDFIYTDLRSLINLRARISDGSLKHIAFEDLWHLFQPGDTLISLEQGQHQLSRAYCITGGQIRKSNPQQNKNSQRGNHEPGKFPPFYRDRTEAQDETSAIGTWTPLKIDCYKTRSDGSLIGQVRTTQRIEYYTGSLNIHDLPTFPLRFHPNADHVARQMLQRAHKYIESYGHKTYNGPAVATGLPSAVAVQQEIEGDVFIDMEAFFHPRTRSPIPHPPPMLPLGTLLKSPIDNSVNLEIVGRECVVLSGDEVDHKLAQDYLASNPSLVQPRGVSSLSQMPESLLQLLPNQVVGYAFRERQWFQLYVELLEDVNKSDEARTTGFEDLVIPSQYRKHLVALVENHASKSVQGNAALSKLNIPTSRIDLVRGKGRGLIILLHGPPGSGKTSTAETIAAYTKKPLYSITCGDLGMNPEKVENALWEHTERAERWGCVLLLDEADVFLMRRDWRDLERNAMVSVFLRQMEYYSGILFLTTNRPGVIDEAFKSRLHVSLLYPALNLESTKAVWSKIMNRLERDNGKTDIKIGFDRGALLRFAEKHYLCHEENGTTWNGRQIRNAFQTAIARGNYDRQEKIKEAGLTVEAAAAGKKKKWNTVKLTPAKFKSIAKTAQDFDDYITALRGPDSQTARDMEFRFDGYNAGRPVARKKYSSRSGKESKKPSATKKGGSGKAGKGSSKAPMIESDDDEDDDDDDDDDEDNDDEDDEEGSEEEKDD